MSGMPSPLPVGFFSPFSQNEILPPREWAMRAVERGYAIAEKIDFWLAMRSIWWLMPFANRKLVRLADSLDAVSEEAEGWMEKPSIAPALQAVVVTAGTNPVFVAKTCTDCSGRLWRESSPGNWIAAAYDAAAGQ
jgi:hypothetical protein